MTKTILLVAFTLGFHWTFAQKEFEYPLAHAESTTNIYFGDSIVDPYQWMENPLNPEVETWINEQQAFTKKLANQQTRTWELRGQLVSMYNDVDRDKTNAFTTYDKETVSKYEFDNKLKNASKSQDLLYKKRGAGNYKLLISAKDYLNHKNDKLDYQSILVNEEDDLVVVSLSINGSDWNTAYIFDLKTGARLPYTLTNLKGSNIHWHNKSLYFTAFASPTKDREHLDIAREQKLYKLQVGQDSIPTLLFTNPDNTGVNPFRFDIKEDKLFLFHFLTSRGNTYRVLSYADLNAPRFFPNNFLVYPNQKSINLSIVHLSNDSIWFKTNWNAPNGKVLLANLNKPNELIPFIPEYDIVLTRVNQLGNNKLAGIYLNKGQNIAMIYNHQGEMLKKIDFPKGKRLNNFYENEDVEHTNFSISSFYHPKLLYQIDLNSLEFKAVESLTVPYDVNNLETRYVTYPSKDGTEVSMYITCQKNVKLNGKNPVMLYGYGGYGTIVQPYYDQSKALFLAHGGILAIPNIRGGGANGSDWALAGRRLNKQNSIDDFIGAAEYLINEEYTQSDKIVINGKSHGGLLVTAAMIQRPELFKAVIAEAGPYDMLRLSNFTVGGVNTNLLEFGYPEIKEDYENLKAYSPLHNIKPGVKYPNLLLITGDSDDRVPPFHTYKFLASLQANADKNALYSLYLIEGAGHGLALTQQDFEELLLYKYYFLFKTLDIDFY